MAKLCDGKPNIRAITDMLSRSGGVIKNLKVWVFYIVKKRLTQHADRRKLAKQWDVPLRDVNAFARITRPTLQYLQKLARKYAALTLEKLDNQIVQITNDTRTWLGKFVSRKLRFVIQSQGMERHDIEGQLRYKGIQGLLNMYPCVETSLHATNVVKRVMHNQGINMIKHYTTQKNGRLQVDGNGAFQARVISIDNVSKTRAGDDSTEANDLKLDANRLLSSYSGKRRRFLELLCGNYCPQFTDWLLDAGYKIETNEELADRLKQKDYSKLALNFLGVEPDAGERFLKKLSVIMKPYSNNLESV